MKRIFAFTLLAAMIAAPACDASAQAFRKKTVTASKSYTSSEVNGLGDFDGIKVTGIADVEYTQSSNGTTEVVISGAENVLKYIKVDVRGGVLHIGTDDKVNIRGEHRLKAAVRNPGVEKMTTTGTGDIDIRGTLTANSLELHTSGTGDIDFGRITANGEVSITSTGTGDIEGGGLKGNTLKIRISGTGDVDLPGIDSRRVDVSVSGTGDADLGGRTDELSIKVSGTGDVDAYGLRATDVKASASGTGTVECYASGTLSASVSGTGGITYGGNPKNVDISGSNPKKVRPRN